jgi:hypothetical protein
MLDFFSGNFDGVSIKNEQFNAIQPVIIASLVLVLFVYCNKKH